MITTVSFAFQRVGSAVPAAIHGFHYACEFGQRSRGEAVWFPGSGRSARKSGSQKWNSDSRGHPLTISISAPLSFSLPLFPPLSLSLVILNLPLILSLSLSLSFCLSLSHTRTLSIFLSLYRHKHKTESNLPSLHEKDESGEWWFFMEGRENPPAPCTIKRQHGVHPLTDRPPSEMAFQTPNTLNYTM